MAQKPIVSPAGIMRWGHVTKPSTKFKEEGEYSVDLLLEGDAAEKFKQQLTEYAEAAKAEKQKENAKVKSFKLHVPCTPDTDQEGNETGGTLFKFKNAASGEKKDGTQFTVTIPIFDARGKKLDNCPLGRGSRIKASFTLIPFANPATKTAGVSLRLKGVQVLELVSYSGDGTADSLGFGEEEGYVAEDTAGDEFAASSAAGNPDGDF